MPIAKQFTPCYLCHGEKLIRVPQADGDRYYGCPACKRRGDVIGEGFTPLAGAETPGLYRLAVAVCQDDRARILAEQYGLRFNGMQELPRGGKAFMFTCLVTGTSLCVRELGDLEDKLREVRARFEPRSGEEL
jgi:hypothetical protein